MTEPSFAPLTPISYLKRSAAVWGDRVATVFGGSTQTYAELLDRCERIAGGMRAHGLEPGDRVAALLPNLPEFLELKFAVAGAGLVLVPMNTRLSEPEYAYILEHASARCLVTSPGLEPLARAAAAAAGKSPELLVVGTGGGFEEMVADAAAYALGCTDESGLFSINYTSGTTGKAKGVMYSHRGSYLHALGVIAEAGLEQTSTYLWTLPMFHCHGWAFPWAVTAVGARHVCLDSVDPSIVWNEIREQRVTHMCAAPTVVSMLLRAEEARPLEYKLRVFIGGSPPAPALLERARQLGMELVHLYGLTETYGPIGVCAWKPEWNDLPWDEQAKLRARQGVSTIVSAPLRVVDADMNDVPADGETIGEIVMRGNNITLGYYRDPDATEDAFSGGWFHSGDLAVMHPDGYVQLQDRLKDIVISGGENVSTVQVEAALIEHPDVVEAAVIGVPDEHWGEVVKAFVVRREPSDLTAEELRDFARARLARFKVPKSIEFMDDLPKTATGKIQKFVLRGLETAARKSG
jgi:fatty-acyl-CoA synthase